LLSADIEARKWNDSTLENLDLNEAESLQRMFHRTVGRHEILLRDALLATFACFLDEPFTMQIGLFLLLMNHDFTLKRIRDVTGSRRIVA
jgi:dihydroorotase